MWVATRSCPAAGHPFYARLNQCSMSMASIATSRAVPPVLRRRRPPRTGARPLLPPAAGRLLRGPGPRARHRVACRGLVGHSSVSRAGPNDARSLDDLAHASADRSRDASAVFTWVQTQLVARACSRARPSPWTPRRWRPMPRCVDSCGATPARHQAYLTQLAEASGIATPTREALARFDRRRKKKGSNDEWTHPDDPDAKITKMKDGRTHLAHKAAHAVDADSGAIVAVTVQGADVGDTSSCRDRRGGRRTAGTHRSAGQLHEIIADKGYHANRRSLIFRARDPRLRVGAGTRPPVWMRTRAVRERSSTRIAAASGGLAASRCCAAAPNGSSAPLPISTRPAASSHAPPRARELLKRLLVHAGGFNLGLIMRQLVGAGTPRGLQGRLVALVRHSSDAAYQSVGSRGRHHAPSPRGISAPERRFDHRIRHSRYRRREK